MNEEQERSGSDIAPYVEMSRCSCTTESATPHELQTTRVNCAVWLYEDGMPDAAVLVLISNRTRLLRSSRRDIQVGLCTV